MKSYDTAIDWHPKFEKIRLADRHLMLISEQENYFLANDRYQHLIEGVDGKTTPNALAVNCPDFRQGALIYQDVNQLLAQGLLTTETVSDSYGLPTQAEAQVLPEAYAHNLSLYNLTSTIQAHHFEGWLHQLNSLAPLGIILTNDYLDPRLEKINREHVKRQIPLLVLKPLGESWLVVFLSLEPNTPCLECLTSQMWRNQPVRRWLQAQQKNNYLPLPVPVAPNAVMKEQMPRFIQRALEQPSVLLEVNAVTLEVKKHAVNARPQCVTCGDVDLIKKQLQQPIVLQSAPNKISNDGGSRLVRAQDTVAKLQSLVSPLTGVITDLTPMPQATNPPIVIYRTAFFRTPPAHHSIANDAFVQVSLGKGIDPIQSQASALCESIERYAAQYQGDEFWFKAMPHELTKRYVLPQQLAAFSETQYQCFAKGEYTKQETKSAVARYDAQTALYWTQVWSLTHQEALFVPFNYCFGNTPFAEDDQYIRWGSNGCAAGNTVEEAILQGFFELVERDATALWWYHQIERQKVDMSSLPEEYAKKFEQTLGEEWNYWVLDISNDLGIPVMAAIGQHKVTRKFCLGFGCHLNAAIACQRALAELCQLVPIRDNNSALFDFDAIEQAPFLMPHGEPKPLNEFPLLESQDIKDDVLFCVKQAQKQGLETLVLNYSRPDLPIKTAKVIVPGLCHIWPQLANKRLYEVPLKMGWSTTLKTATEFNPHLLYI